MDDQTLVFVNRTRVPTRSFAELQVLCQRAMRDAQVFPTIMPGEIHEPIERLKPKNVFIVGGDGSGNEALGLALKHDFTLGIIPHGTGNDHASALGFANDLKKHLKKGREDKATAYLRPFIATANGNNDYLKQVDVGVFNVDGKMDQYFANSIGVGYFADVNHAAQAYNGFEKPYLRLALQERRARAKRGPFSFELSTKTEKGWREEPASGVNLDLLIGNYFGNHKRINPHGKVDDGEAELFILDTTRNSSYWPNIISVLANKEAHLKNKHLDYRTGIRALEALFKEPQVLQYDGEAYPHKATALYVHIHPQAVTMVTNKKS